MPLLQSNTRTDRQLFYKKAAKMYELILTFCAGLTELECGCVTFPETKTHVFVFHFLVKRLCICPFVGLSKAHIYAENVHCLILS